MIIHYARNTKQAAQELRRNMTPQERHLWYDFLRTYPVQFRRQKQFGRFIVDFYCAKAKLVVELDGAHHFDAQGIAYDQERSAFLAQYGLLVLRFPNSRIENHFPDVCDEIDRIVALRAAQANEPQNSLP